MSKIAVFPGTFDPVTIGHESIVERASRMFDKIYVAIGVNSSKNTLFTLEKRKEWLTTCFEKNKKIEICVYEGLTVDLCRKVEADFIIRGIRNSADFEYERIIVEVNRQLNGQIETIFLPTLPEFSHISSSIVREIYLNKGEYRKFVPAKIILTHNIEC